MKKKLMPLIEIKYSLFYKLDQITHSVQVLLGSVK